MNSGGTLRALTTKSLGIKQRKASKVNTQPERRANIEGQTPPAEKSCRLSLTNFYNAFIAAAASIIAINFLPLIKDDQKTSTTATYTTDLVNNLSTTTETITSSEIISTPFQTIKGKNIPYDYDEEFLQKYPFEAFLVMNAGGVVQSQCFATFVDC